MTGGRLLDGVQHDGYPEHPKVREWMEARERARREAEAGKAARASSGGVR